MARGRIKLEDRKREVHLRKGVLPAPVMKNLTLEAMESLEKYIGGRETLAKTLGYAKNEKMNALVRMLRNPIYVEAPLESMLEECQIRPVEVLEGIRARAARPAATAKAEAKTFCSRATAGVGSRW